MRKSPLSTPGGSGGQRDYEWNSRGRRHGYNGTGYDQFQRGENVCNDSFGAGPMQASPRKTVDDFIPLGYSSPMNQHQHQQRNGGNWRGSGGWYGRRGAAGTGGHNSNRNNSYHSSPRSSFNDSNSPNYYQKKNFSHRRTHQKDAHRQVDISCYVNVRSMLEDPWADLMREFKSNNGLSGEHESDLPKGESISKSNVTEDVGFQLDKANDIDVPKDSIEEADVDTKAS